MKSEKKIKKTSYFAICINNKGYSASLEKRKLYQVVKDREGEKYRLIRVIDESNEDYLYPEDYFMPISIPQSVKKALSLTK